MEENPSKKDPEKRRKRRDKYADKKRKSETCPNSPRRSSAKKVYSMSEHSTPVRWEESLVQTDLRDRLNTFHAKPNNANRKEKRDRAKMRKKTEDKEYRRITSRKNVEIAYSPFENSGESKKEKKRQKFYNSVMRQQQQKFVDLSAVSRKKLHAAKYKMVAEPKKKHKMKADVHLPSFYKYAKM